MVPGELQETAECHHRHRRRRRFGTKKIGENMETMTKSYHNTRTAGPNTTVKDANFQKQGRGKKTDKEYREKTATQTKVAGPKRIGENPLRQKFVAIRNLAQGAKCGIKGELKLTGGSAKSPMTIKCGKCSFVKEKEEAEEEVRRALQAVQTESAKSPVQRETNTVDMRVSNTSCEINRVSQIEKKMEELEARFITNERKVIMLEAKVRAQEEENKILRENQSENLKNEETANTTATTEITSTAETLEERDAQDP